MSLDRPWARVAEIELIPSPLNGRALRELGGSQFAGLIRDHLVPRQPAAEARRQWEQLWDLLAGDDELAERALDVLEQFLDTTEAALHGELDEHQTRRASKFLRFCDDAWNRLDRGDDVRPLGWAGKAGRGFNPAAAKVIARIVDAIDTHRDAVGEHGSSADKQLWAVLREVDLDPRRSRAPRG